MSLYYANTLIESKLNMIKCSKRLLALIPLQFALLLVGATHATATSRPNVVVIVADDLGYADMSFLPQAPDDVKHFGTPGFDRLAKTGTYFANGYATSAICSPSRTGLITGRYQQRWGNYSYGEGGLDPRELTIPEKLNDLGYATSKVGKTHMNSGPKTYPATLHGFEEFLGFQGGMTDYLRLSQKDLEAYRSRARGASGHHRVGPLTRAVGRGSGKQEEVSYENRLITDIFTEEAIEFIQRQEGGTRPFYLHLSHLAVHVPTSVVDKKWAKKVGAPYVPWDRNAAKWEYPYWEPNECAALDFHRRWNHMGEVDPNGRRCYLSHLLALDDSISQVLDALEASGLRENTVIFFVSDNGGTINTYANNAPLRGFKYMYGEGGIRIPFMVSMPGTLPEGRFDTEALVSAMDIFPTILDLIGEPPQENHDGKSLLPVLRGEKKTQHEWLAWAMNREKWAIRKGKWKLSNNNEWKHVNFRIDEKGFCHSVPEPVTYPGGLQLFNLEDDIGETVNLSTKHPEVVEQLKALQAAWSDQMADPIPSREKYAKSKN